MNCDRTVNIDLSPKLPRLLRLRNQGLSSLLILIACGLTASALAGEHESHKQSGPGLYVHHWLQVGQASWYGHKFQGHKTATGEQFDMNGLTCAHRSLPLGSWIRVTNLRTRRSIFVRVNDRGPMVDDRILDLSYAAARAVGLKGVGKVSVETVSAADPEMTRALLAQLHVPTFTPAASLR